VFIEHSALTVSWWRTQRVCVIATRPLHSVL